jgi:hypothetical protein
MLDLALVVVSIPLLSLTVGWLYGAKYQPPLVEPELYTQWKDHK